ncbi:hypothetical protein [Rossellomorea aquimaris]|uniref:hypothetical protein n=1 Tax=Rossellomorea aquimaris TaxID=189382 RepID=UPI0007D04D01|nr:hypothetical protein [Rossellomorea aquimaris]
MKRKIIILAMAFLICTFIYSMFNNGFSEIESIVIQKYDEPFEKEMQTVDKEEIGTVSGILNRSNHIVFTRYEFASEPEYKIQLIYLDKTREELYFHENFSNNTTLIASNLGEYYKINNKQTKIILDLLLKEK